MSQYEGLDINVVEAVKCRPLSFRELLFRTPGVASETRRIADATGRDRARVLDGRLAALRKRGLIKSVGQKWHIVEEQR